MNMLDNLDWVEVKPCNSKSKFHFVEHLLVNNAEICWLLIINSCSFVIMHILAQESFFGIMLKILFKRVSDFIRQLLTYSRYRYSQLIEHYLKGTKTGTTTMTDEESYDDDDTLAECTSLKLPVIETEEIHPKDMDLEEKLNYGSVQDIGMTDLADISPNWDDHESSCKDAPFTPHDVDGPEKLDRFLHHTHENPEKLGISLADIDDDTFVERLANLRESRSNH